MWPLNVQLYRFWNILKTKQKTIRHLMLRTIWFSCKLHGSMTFEMFVKLWSSFLGKIKTQKPRRLYIQIWQKTFLWRKKYKVINITILESTDNGYYVTRPNLHFAHAPYNKNKNKKWQRRSGLTIKCFDSKIILFGQDWVEIISFG